MELLSKIKPLPELNNYISLEDKFNAVVDYLSMDQVIVLIPDMSGFSRMPAYNQLFDVTDIIGPRTSYIKSYVKELLEIFPEFLDNLLWDGNDYNNITERLVTIKNKCIKLHERLNLTDDLTFEESFRYYVEHNDDLQNIPYCHLRFNNDAYNELVRHFNLRSIFFLKLAILIEEKLRWHLTPPQRDKEFFIWDSPNAELEVSELVYNLCYLSQRIKINQPAGGSFAKFKREFFGLFGLDDTVYNKRLGTIKGRKKNQHFANVLLQKLNESSPTDN